MDDGGGAIREHHPPQGGIGKGGDAHLELLVALVADRGAAADQIAGVFGGAQHGAGGGVDAGDPAALAAVVQAAVMHKRHTIGVHVHVVVGEATTVGAGAEARQGLCGAGG